MNLLFSVDDNYTKQMETTIFSIAKNTTISQADVYVLQKQPLARNKETEAFLASLGYRYIPVVIGDTGFSDAPTTDRYPETIYYRLLAHEFLPADLDRVLYLDADILCINDFSELWELDMTGMCYAASSHSRLTNMLNKVNEARLQSKSHKYYNSGVMLMNLAEIRRRVKREDIFAYIKSRRFTLILPDQDVLNGLYGDRIIDLPDEYYNLDMRYSKTYEAISGGTYTPGWIIENTRFLHYCGRAKPWYEENNGAYDILYKHYDHLKKRQQAQLD